MRSSIPVALSRLASRRAATSLIAATLALLFGALLWLHWQSLPSGLFVDNVARFRADVADMAGVTEVEEAEIRAGDLTFRDNAFVSIETDLRVDDPGLHELIAAIAIRSASGQSSTRILPVLNAGRVSIGVSPHEALNEVRLRIAEDLSSLDGVIAVSVLWPQSGDDLIYDETNEQLDVTAQTRTGTVADLAASMSALTRAIAPDAVLTAIVLADSDAEARTHRHS